MKNDPGGKTATRQTGAARLGYARVSTGDQDHALQIDALNAAGVDKIFTDTMSGSKAERPGLRDLLDYARPGDTLVTWKLDRLGRSAIAVMQLANDLRELGIELHITTLNIDTNTSAGKLVYTILAGVAEMERDMIRERTNAGLDAARARGRVGGRPTVWTPERVTTAERMLAGGATATEIAQACSVSIKSVRRWLTARREVA